MKSTADLISLSSTSHHNLVEVRMRRSDFGSLSQYIEFKDGLISKSNNPWIKKFNNDRAGDGGGIWAIVIGDSSNGELKVDQLLDFEEFYSEISHPLPSFGEVSSFEEWVSMFNPVTRGDWLMAPKLFKSHLLYRIKHNELTATPCLWIDAMLRESRGWLIWSYQAIEVIRLTANVGRSKATEMYFNYCANRSDWETDFEEVKSFATELTLRQIFEERVEFKYVLGCPDYFVSDWLDRNYAQATWGQQLGF
jgi:hypothetical protein